MNTANSGVTFAVFTKPWPRTPLPALARQVREYGFDSVEVPVRPGFQVEPSTVATGLPELVALFADHGLKVTSIASSLDEPIFAACAEAGVPTIRIMAPMARGAYDDAEVAFRTSLGDVTALCEKYEVRVAVQEHYGDQVNSALGLRSLLKGIDSPYIGAIFDAAHDALAGMEPETGLGLVWDRLAMVNLKNAYYERTNGPEAQEATWRRYFTSARHGLASWPRVVAELKRRNYSGVVCLTAEYTEEQEVDRLCREDLVYAKQLFGTA